jgi:RNA polymerase sigma factor (sigma-70 family)
MVERQSAENADSVASVSPDSVPQLIRDSRAGDTEAFARLYAGHVGPLRGYARRLVLQEPAAEDLVAEAFARTWEQLRAGGGPTVAFMGYLRAVVLNGHLRQLRRDKGLMWVADLEEAGMACPGLATRLAEQSPEHLVLEQLLHTHLRHALATLPHRWQQVLVMVYVEARSYREVAAQLGLTVEATRQLSVRARGGARQALASLADEDRAA